MHLRYGVCRLGARVHLKTLSSLLNKVKVGFVPEYYDLPKLGKHCSSDLSSLVKIVRGFYKRKLEGSEESLFCMNRYFREVLILSLFYVFR